jgi:hypothetical protein
MRALAFLIAVVAVSSTGCGQSAPAMPRATFVEAANLCGLRKTSYTPRRWMGLDEPLIDFSREAEPEQAHQCFNHALETVDERTMASDHAFREHLSYIWAWTI